MKSTKKALFMSCLSLLLCVSMLIGSTFAWFTDTVTSGVNQIIAGNLDIEVSYKDGSEWKSIEGVSSLFDPNALWEPGHTEFVTLKVENKGTLALNYKMLVSPVSENGGINKAGQSFKLSDYLMFGTTAASTTEPTYTRETAREAATNAGLLNQSGLNQSSAMDASADAQYITLVVYMPEDVGNEANYKTGTTAPQINLGITVLATQHTVEEDSFDHTYDAGAVNSNYNGVGPVYDYFVQAAASAPVAQNEDIIVIASGKLNKGDADATELAKVIVPAAAIAADAEEITVSVKPVAPAADSTAQNTIAAEKAAGREAVNFDIHVEGIAADNNEPITVTVFVGKGLSSVKAFHNGAPIDGAQYDATTGKVTFTTTSFSDYTVSYAPAVAAIGSQTYGSLELAVAAASNDGTVVLLKSCSGNGVVVDSGRSVTVNFNGFTYNIDGTTVGSSGTANNGFQLLKDSNITFKNGTLTSDKAKILIQNYSNLTLENMVLDGTKLVGSDKYVASNNNGNVQIKNTTINAASDGVAFDVYSFSSYTGANVTVENSVINGKIEVGASNGADTSNLGLTIASGTVKGAIVPAEASFAGKISIQGGTFANDPTAYLDTGKMAAKNSNGMFVVENAPTADKEGVYSISNAAQLLWFAQQVNEHGNNFSNKTVKLTADIDMSGITWTPIGNVNSYPGVTFNGTFDGQNHIVSNVTGFDAAKDYAAAGFFGSICGTVKNLTLKNVDFTSTHYVGGIVGYSSANTATLIENCHVIGGKITSNCELLASGEYDNGDKVGGIIGYCVGGDVIRNCSVTNVTIKGYRDIGGICGYANDGNSDKITNCSISGVKIIVDNSHNYKGYTSNEQYDANSIIGECTKTTDPSCSGVAEIVYPN